jgi:hypothetical protein
VLKLSSSARILKREEAPHRQSRKLKRNVTGCWKGRMKRRLRVMRKSSEALSRRKNEIPQRRTFHKWRRLKKNIIEEMDIQEDLLLLGIKEASIIVNGKTEEKISQGMNSEGLHHKEYHSLPRIKVYFMVIVLLVINLDIKMYIA